MANAFWGAVMASSHPCLEWEGFFCTGYYVCSCGHRTRSEKVHNDHVIELHTQSEAYDLLPAKLYHKAYKTPEYIEKMALQKKNRQVGQLLRKNGFKKIPKSNIFSMAYDWWKDNKGYSTEQALKNINYEKD